MPSLILTRDIIAARILAIIDGKVGVCAISLVKYALHGCSETTTVSIVDMESDSRRLYAVGWSVKESDNVYIQRSVFLVGMDWHIGKCRRRYYIHGYTQACTYRKVL